MEIQLLHIDAFGKYQNRSFSFEKGFNLIYGLNEEGKSTLLHFIRAMLYGIGDNRESGGQLSFRRRFQSFDYAGKTGGSLLFTHEGKAYHLQRSFGQASRFDTLSLTYADTGEKIALPDKCEVGEFLLSLSETAFISTFYIGQMGLRFADKAADTLSARLENLTSSGDEGQAYTQVDAILRKKAAALQGERARTGLLPQKKNELTALQTRCDQAISAFEKEAEVQRQISVLQGQKQALLDRERRTEEDLKAQLSALRKERETEYTARQALWEKENAKYIENAALLQKDHQPINETYFALVEKKREDYLSNLAVLSQNTKRLKTDTALLQKAQEECIPPALTQEDLTHAKQSLEKAHQIEKEKEALLQKAREEENALLQKEHSEQELKRVRENSLIKAQMERLNRISLAKERLRIAQEKVKEAEAQDAEQRKTAALAKENFDKESASFQDAQNRLKNVQALYEDSFRRLQSAMEEQKEAETAFRLLQKKKKTFLAVFFLSILLLLCGVFVVYTFLPSIWYYPFFLLPLLFFLFFLLPSPSSVKKAAAKQKQTSETYNTLRIQEENASHQLDQYKTILDMNRQQRATAAAAFDAENKVLSSLVVQLQNAKKGQSSAEKEVQSAQEIPIEEPTGIEALPNAQDIHKTQERTKKLQGEWENAQKQCRDEEEAFLAYLRVHGFVDENALLQALASYESAVKTVHQAEEMWERADRQKKEQEKLTQEALQSYCQMLHPSLSTQEAADTYLAKLKTLYHEQAERSVKINSLHTVLQHLEFELRAMPEETAPNEIKANEMPVYNEETRQELEKTKENLRLSLEKINHEIAIFTERLRLMGQNTENPTEIQRKIQKTESEIEDLTQEYNAYLQARKALSSANDEMRLLFAPKINRLSSSYLGKLTGKENADLLLGKDFGMQLQDGETLHRHDARFYSGGTLDQCYLSVRLALCDILEIQSPLLLDDALVQFDDLRAQKALLCLMELAKTRQVLFFTCHGRLLQEAEQNGGTILTLMQEEALS